MTAPDGVGRLQGVRVLVTRPRERARELCFLLEDEGAEVVAVPVLELQPPDDERPLRSASEHLHRYRWVLFSSPSGVQALMDAAREAGTVEQLSKVRLGAVGPATARAIRGYGLEVACEAAESSGAGLFAALKEHLQRTDEVLLPVAQEGRWELQHGLEEAGIRVARVSAYRSAPTPIDKQSWTELKAAFPEVAIFASPRSAEAFLDGTGTEGHALLGRAKVVAIGPTTAQALTELGFTPAAVAERPTSAELVEAAVRAVRG